MISDEQIIKFQTLYKNRFGKEISREEAYEQGAKLLRLVELIYKPMTEKEYQKLQERRQETGDINNKKNEAENMESFTEIEPCKCEICSMHDDL